jgi:hypothetical protein
VEYFLNDQAYPPETIFSLLLVPSGAKQTAKNTIIGIVFLAVAGYALFDQTIQFFHRGIATCPVLAARRPTFLARFRGVNSMKPMRLVHQEGRRQENIEAITLEAASRLKDGAKPEAIEDDWLAAFFAKAKDYSDADMRSIWSRIGHLEG